MLSTGLQPYEALWEAGAKLNVIFKNPTGKGFWYIHGYSGAFSRYLKSAEDPNQTKALFITLV